MKLTLDRKWAKPTHTVGILYVDGVRFCETLEDPVVDTDKSGKFDGDEKKVYGESAIPYGEYEVIYSYSPKFGRKLPLLLNVPHFSGIRIHPGNTTADTSGCLLVGKNTHVGRLTRSREFSDSLNQLISDAIGRGETVKIRIV